MKRLTVIAAALAAGMLTIVSQSQAESDRDMFRMIEKAPGTKLKKAEEPKVQDVTAKAKPVAKPAKTSSRKAKRSKTGPGRPGVDAETTASTSRARPQLIAIARKSVEGDVVDLFNAGKTTGVAAKAGGYTTLVSRYATSYGVPVSLAHAVIGIESNYRPDTLGRAGEIGLMQIKPATARMMGYTGSAIGLFNPETNIKYGMKYLGLAHQLSGGATCGTILRYNAGHGAKRMNPVSAAYCSKVKQQLAGG